jgi:hypothetical protein
MHFMRSSMGYTLMGHKRNEELTSELQIPEITKFI